MAVTNVTTGQALVALKAAFTKDAIEQQGKLALEQIQAVTSNQADMQTNRPTPSERIGSQINLKA